MKKPVLEVIRFDEADIITSSGMGFSLAGFDDNEKGNGTFTFFGGTGSVTSVTTEADYNGVLEAFKSNFRQNWSSTADIWVDGSDGGSSLWEMIGRDRGDMVPNAADYQKYDGTYYYNGNGIFSWRSN